jgi:hypothetical protein
MNPATESSRELSVTGCGRIKEPLGTSVLNEELEDDRHESADIIFFLWTVYSFFSSFWL